MIHADPHALLRLARSRGVITSYGGHEGARHDADPDALAAVLQALGEEIASPADAAGALLEQRSRPSPIAEPVHVMWDGRGHGPQVRLGRNVSKVSCELELEEEETFRWVERAEGGTEHVLRLPRRIPNGRHTLRLRVGREEATVTILSARPRIGDLAQERDAEESERGRVAHARDLATFIPLYAIRSDTNWGIGDLGDLDRLQRWAGDNGCSHVGTLPLLSAFLDEPFEPSPYAPVSRLFWNEAYLDLSRCAELAASAEARRLIESTAFDDAVRAARNGDAVDYRAVMMLKARVLDLLADAAFERMPGRRREIDAFLRARPELGGYAAFRARAERLGKGWSAWGGRTGKALRPTDEQERRAHRRHVLAQLLMHEQLGACATRDHAAASRKAALYLDLPIGVHRDGFDTWLHRDAFALDVSAGAPPDALGPAGQDWGFPPLHPDRSRADGHAYFASVIRNHLRYASLLRIDHVMGLHRLYWIPRGIEASRGVYVRYPADELYAVLSIEAERAGARIVGENLGTVPPEVNRALATRGMLGMHVAQFSMRPEPRRPVSLPTGDVLACVNTHDTPTFAAFFNGTDIDDRVAQGLTTPEHAKAEREGRRALTEALTVFAAKNGAHDATSNDTERALRAVLRALAASDAEVVLVTLEDLWGETRPQNVPGTCGDHNWRRRAARTLESILADRSLAETLQDLARLRTATPASSRDASRSATRFARDHDRIDHPGDAHHPHRSQVHARPPRPAHAERMP